jgi:hypothetical protein
MNDTFSKDPNAVLDYAFDWTEWLESAETIDTFQVTGSTGITVDSTNNLGKKIIVWLSGGTAGQGYAILCHIVTSMNRIDDKTMYIICREE